MNSLKKSLIAIFVAIPLTWIISAIYQDRTFDLQLHDTYFVVHPYALAQIFTVGLAGVLSLYFVLSRGNGYLNKALTATHAIFVLTIILLLGILFHFLTAYEEVSRYSFDPTLINYLVTIVFTLIILSVIIFVINLMAGLIQKMKE